MAKTPALFRDHGLRTVFILWCDHSVEWRSSDEKTASADFCLGGSFGGTVFIIMALKVKLLTIREWLLVPFGKNC